MQFSKPDLIMIMGTALAVAPFNVIPSMLGANVPKVLFNMNNVADTSAYDFCDNKGDKLFV